MGIYSQAIEQQEASDYIAEQLELGQDTVEPLPAFRYNGVTYITYEDVCEAVMSKHPELLDDELPDYINNHVEEL